MLIVLSLLLIIIAESAYIAKMEISSYFSNNDVIIPIPSMLAIQDEKYNSDSGVLSVEVQNIGAKIVLIETLRVDGVAQTFSSSSNQLILLPTNETWLTANSLRGCTQAKGLHVTVVCTDGNSEEEVGQ